MTLVPLPQRPLARVRCVGSRDRLADIGCCVLYCLIEEPEGRLAFLGSDGVALLGQVMQAHPYSPAIQEHACWMLDSLARADKDNVPLLLQEGCLVSLVQALRTHASSTTLVDWALKATHTAMLASYLVKVCGCGGFHSHHASSLKLICLRPPQNTPTNKSPDLCVTPPSSSQEELRTAGGVQLLVAVLDGTSQRLRWKTLMSDSRCTHTRPRHRQTQAHKCRSACACIC